MFAGNGPKHSVANVNDSVHAVTGRCMRPPWPERSRVVYLGMGCFWGVERLFWQLPGVYVTAVGYGGGETEDPDYEGVCSGLTGHVELVMIVYFPEILPEQVLFSHFWQQHDPTQGLRQGNDIGSQYRSAVYFTDPVQQKAVETMRADYQTQLVAAGFGRITTGIHPAGRFYYAETYHQQYYEKYEEQKGAIHPRVIYKRQIKKLKN